MNLAPSDLTLFLGRFHPLLVHLPIGFFVLLALLELLILLPRFKHLASLRGVVAALAVPASLLSALCGWLLSRGGGYDATLLQWHQWAGFGVAAASLATFLVWRLRRPTAYRIVLAGTCAVLVFASHHGGSLTHGRDYLTRYAPAPLRSLLGAKSQSPGRSAGVPSATKPAFAAVVAPVLDHYCIGCHGPEKSKGNLRLDTLEALRHGGESGPPVVPGQAASSLILKLLRAAPDDERHMPPSGKPQPSADEIALLEWWIEAGAPGEKTVPELNPPPRIQLILQSLLAHPQHPTNSTRITE